jgi:hypothetical protein
MKIVILSDGETFDLLDNCTIIEVPDDSTTESIEEHLRNHTK